MNEYLEYITHDILVDIPGITSRAMFGGYGIYQYGIVFAIVVDDELYFKVDEDSKIDYESMGSHAFTYTRKNNKKVITMSYLLLPEEIIDDKDRLREWVDIAVAISRKGKVKKKKKSK